MKTSTLMFCFALLPACAGCGGGGKGEVPATDEPNPDIVADAVWSFDADTAGSVPLGFQSALGTWQVAADASAPSGANVVRQTAADPSTGYPRLLESATSLGDLTVRVKCRPESGSVDQACGLLFRSQGADDYMLVRANVLESNIRFYKVVGGSRTQIASTGRTVTANEWHTLQVTAIGQDVWVRWDGEPVLASVDSTFLTGGVGLWLKADSVTAFDDLEVAGR